MTPTEEYINRLLSLKPGELNLLRCLAGQPPDRTLSGFDLFAGLWWPLRQKSPGAPRRAVAWLVAKLYTFAPMPNAPGSSLPKLLRRLAGRDPGRLMKFQQRIDQMLLLPLTQIEPGLQWALLELRRGRAQALDWVQFADDLSFWERGCTRTKWAQEFLMPASSPHEKGDRRAY